LSQIRQFAALRYFTLLCVIHTKTYYTHIFKKVNKNMRKFSTKEVTSSRSFCINLSSQFVIIPFLHIHSQQERTQNRHPFPQ
jgi:hypothetical protein